MSVAWQVWNAPILRCTATQPRFSATWELKVTPSWESRDCKISVSSEQWIYPCCTNKSNHREEKRPDISEFKLRGEVFVLRMAHDRNLQKPKVQCHFKQSRENSEPYSHDTIFYFILVNSLYIKPQSRDYRWSTTMQAALVADKANAEHTRR